MTHPTDIRTIILKAISDERIFADALIKAERLTYRDVLGRNRDRTGLRASDAGRCKRELWADVHGLRDLPEDPNGLLKMNLGSLSGAWLACLLAAGVEHTLPRTSVAVEVEVEHDGVSGHADAILVYHDENGTEVPVLVVEFKLSFWTGAHDGPKPYHLIQAAKYALAKGCERFVVVQYYPSTQARFDKRLGTKVAEPALEPSQIYTTNDYVDDVAKEYARLSAAFDDAMPEGDPAEGFRCRSCRFSQCERNENVLNPHRQSKSGPHAIGKSA